MKEESNNLAKKIKAAQEKLDEGDGRPPPPGASRYSIELLSGVVVGGLLGWGADMLFGTKPWIFIVFLLLGTCGGFLNIVKLARRQDLGHIDADSKK